jgi:hypothetical protein
MKRRMYPSIRATAAARQQPVQAALLGFPICLVLGCAQASDARPPKEEPTEVDEDAGPTETPESAEAHESIRVLRGDPQQSSWWI